MIQSKTILVTGGAGYIGSHTVIELLSQGYKVVIVDNLCNSNIQVLNRTWQITQQKPVFYPIDIRDTQALDSVFTKHEIDAVIHFAALKAVGESVALPLQYYDNNVTGSLALFNVMRAHGVKNLVFSSSATVYGDPATTPIAEDAPLKPTNPYGYTKFVIEQVLRDMYAADNTWRIAILRYFNPVGAHASGLIGEDPNGIPNNLMPYINQVAVGKQPYLNIWGNDYPTSDGTGVRDYIHVVDLARGHALALDYLEQHQDIITVNLGTGVGYSVLEVVHAFEQASGKTVAYQFANRRPGDIATCFANCDLAFKLLGFKTEFALERMCQDSFAWQSKNPNGYTT